MSMKPSNRYRVKPAKIHSLKDIEIEKQRLRLEISRTEASIQNEYHGILNALTFKNIAATTVNRIATTSSVISKAIMFGRKIMEHRKKKKKNHDAEVRMTNDE